MRVRGVCVWVLRVNTRPRVHACFFLAFCLCWCLRTSAPLSAPLSVPVCACVCMHAPAHTHARLTRVSQGDVVPALGIMHEVLASPHFTDFLCERSLTSILSATDQKVQLIQSPIVTTFPSHTIDG